MASESRSKVPGVDQLLARGASYSSAEPSHQWIASGLRQLRDLLDPGQSFWCFVGTVVVVCSLVVRSTPRSSVRDTAARSSRATAGIVAALPAEPCS